jgi:hypothetical protein
MAAVDARHVLIFAPAEPGDALRDAEFGRQGPPSYFGRASTRQRQARVGTGLQELGEGPQAELHALPRDMTPNIKKAKTLALCVLVGERARSDLAIVDPDLTLHDTFGAIPPWYGHGAFRRSDEDHVRHLECYSHKRIAPIDPIGGVSQSLKKRDPQAHGVGQLCRRRFAAADRSENELLRNAAEKRRKAHTANGDGVHDIERLLPSDAQCSTSCAPLPIDVVELKKKAPLTC